MTEEERGMGYQNALLCATEYRRCESRLTGVEPQLGVTPCQGKVEIVRTGRYSRGSQIRVDRVID
jgi:hypothetical protein